MDNQVNVTVKIDVERIKSVLEKIAKLENNDQVFRLLSNVAKPKKQLEDALEQVEAAERQIKQTISDCARALYGDDWAAIEGQGYKIARQFGGAVYEKIGDVAPEFVKITETLDSDAITTFVKANGKLPKGVAPNKARSEQIRLTVKE